MTTGRTRKKAAGTRQRRQGPSSATARVLLTGATGFVGRHVLRRLLERGRQVVAVARHPSAERVPSGVIQVTADLLADGWERWSEGCEAAIHLVGIIQEIPRQGVTFDRFHRVATEKVVEVCQRQGIRRLVHVSALGARPQAPTAYFSSKYEAEEAVRRSGLEWTIFRPSVLFGPGDGFSTTLARSLRRTPVFPVLGDGRYRAQPIAVAEVADALVASLELPASEGRVFELGGPEALSFDELVHRTARALGLHRTLLHVPLRLARPLVKLVEHLPAAPITSEQLTMLLEGSTCDTTASREIFGVPNARYEGPVWLTAQ